MGVYLVYCVTLIIFWSLAILLKPLQAKVSKYIWLKKYFFLLYHILGFM